MTTVLGFELGEDGTATVDLGGGIRATLRQATRGDVVVPGVLFCRSGQPYSIGVHINAGGPDEMTAQMRLLDELAFVRDAIDALLTMGPEVAK